jgi:hypothetical protein
MGASYKAFRGWEEENGAWKMPYFTGRCWRPDVKEEVRAELSKLIRRRELCGGMVMVGGGGWRLW